MKAKLPTLLIAIALLMQMAFTENDHTIDSLNGELGKAKNEIRQLHFKTQIAAAMDNKDSAVVILEYVINRAAEIKESHVELEANKTLSAIYMNIQDWDNAMPSIRRSEFLAHEMHDTLNQAEAIMNFARAGAAKNNFKKSESLFRNAEMLLVTTGMPDKTYLQKLGQVMHYHADLFAQQQMLDSAQHQEERAVALFTQAGDNAGKGMSLASLAAVQSKQNNHQGAIMSLNLALDVCTAADAPEEIATGLSQLAMEYSAAGNLKMAQQKADSALLIARAVNTPHVKAAAYQALAVVNEKGNDFKQALHYYDSATVLNTQILNEQSAARVASAQQKYVHQSENILADKEEAAALRVKNMRMMGGGIFLLTVLVFGFAVSRHKHGPLVTKVLGAIALLLTFELISLVAHPLMEKWTHHSSLYMLLILALVAGILVSLHHQIEDMVRKVFHTEE